MLRKYIFCPIFESLCDINNYASYLRKRNKNRMLAFKIKQSKETVSTSRFTAS